ncbi:hypothetical protein COU80_02990 [Candidatus Peregrinibacteria bacterium CG10_big_fil_rev_8_21_14_0_10_55_24]|nr:MAG: hypothetical protein COU80_02990 [Candidatus Peregrinibacteria bacterium CG10_big_fil_rev_8_21_14_0_10_55_24]
MVNKALPSSEDRLVRSLDRLNTSVTALIELQTEQSKTSRRLGFFFLRGVFYGLGILVAIAIIIPIVIQILHSVQWVPLLGDFLIEVIERMEQASQVR